MNFFVYFSIFMVAYIVCNLFNYYESVKSINCTKEIENCLDCELLNGIKICHKCKNNYYVKIEFPIDSCQNCYESCLECYKEGNEYYHNCKKCKNGYYKLNGTNNCYEYNVNKNIFLKNYYLENNLIIKCIKNCSQCDNLNECSECNDKYFLYNKKCLTIDQLPINTYIDYDNKIAYDCYESCEKCENNGNSLNHNCTLCKNKYYIFRNKEMNTVFNCYKNETTENPNLSNFYINITTNSWENCSINCKTCFDSSNFNSMNCLSCNIENGYFPIEGTLNCSKKNKKIPYYYFSEKFQKFKNCEEGYLFCDSNSEEYLEDEYYNEIFNEKENYPCVPGYYFSQSKCNKIPENKYFNKENNKLEDCHFS